jgi:hypothetical protein
VCVSECDREVSITRRPLATSGAIVSSKERDEMSHNPLSL